MSEDSCPRRVHKAFVALLGTASVVGACCLRRQWFGRERGQGGYSSSRRRTACRPSTPSSGDRCVQRGDRRERRRQEHQVATRAVQGDCGGPAGDSVVQADPSERRPGCSRTKYRDAMARHSSTGSVDDERRHLPRWDDPLTFLASPGRSPLSRPLRGAQTLDDVRRVAARGMPRPVFGFVDGAAVDEVAARWSLRVLRAIELMPWALTGEEPDSLATTGPRSSGGGIGGRGVPRHSRPPTRHPDGSARAFRCVRRPGRLPAVTACRVRHRCSGERGRWSVADAPTMRQYKDSPLRADGPTPTRRR